MNARFLFKEIDNQKMKAVISTIWYFKLHSALALANCYYGKHTNIFPLKTQITRYSGMNGECPSSALQLVSVHS